jgi:hypothetical protein
MKKSIFAFILIAAIAGCIPSVHPFYSEKDAIFDQRLLGEWQAKEQADDPQVWKFERDEGNAYKLKVTEKEGKYGEFKAHLFKLKEDYFLDIVPGECRFDAKQADMISFSLIAGHLLLRVPEFEPNLKLAFCDFDWLEKYLEKNPKSLPHYSEDKRLVLTADTSELQGFILQHLGENELFQKPAELVRRSGAGPK